LWRSEFYGGKPALLPPATAAAIPTVVGCLKQECLCPPAASPCCRLEAKHNQRRAAVSEALAARGHTPDRVQGLVKGTDAGIYIWVRYCLLSSPGCSVQCARCMVCA
jgi:hypothetical protein